MSDYATVDQLKARLYAPGTVDTVNDAVLADVITATSRLIERYTGRVFTQVTSQARYFSAADRYRVYVDDLVSVDSGGFCTDDNADRTFSNVWATTDYELCPRNAAAHNNPYTWIQVPPNGNNVFPSWPESIKITGTWGWSAVPQEVTEACLIQAARLFRRKDTPFGIMDSAASMTSRALTLDVDVAQLLAGVTRMYR